MSLRCNSCRGLLTNGPSYILTIDQGTTGTRAVLFNDDGSIVRGGWAYYEHKQIYPKPGWVEHDPLEIWDKTKSCICKVMSQAKVDPKNIIAIGVTNQRETVVVWDAVSGRPLYNAIVWQDRRTAKEVDYLREHYLDMIREKTGLVPDCYFSSTKVWWILDNIPGVRGGAKSGRVLFGTIDAWIIWNLTRGSKDVLTPEKNGAHVTDFSNASRTMMFDIHKLDWDDELLEVQGKIPREALPLARPSSDKEFYGYTGPEATELLGGVSVPVVSAVGDQQAALFGQAGFDVGEVKCTYGTGSFILLNTGEVPIKSKRNLLTTVFYSLEHKKVVYALEGSIFVTGAAIQWLRDGLKIIEVSSEVNPLAESTSDTGGVYFVPAFVGLGAPYWDQYARGLIIGITRGTERKHIARAALEAIAYLTRDVIEAMKVDLGRDIAVLKADGGASRSDFLLQFQADILGVKVVRPMIHETTSLGVAYLAGLAVELWKSLDEVRKNWKPEKEFVPQMTPDMRDKLYAGWKAAVKRALGWAKEVPWAYGY
ncbi:MAG: glycerol kinase GlpK [Candidatus Nezhaarchaeota archaeon]|nr:glycerol kinase GlpK [Candidatus Nezhaarchaeota archaeon]MCX8141330.1 glycerol kinase GlpK [Candidatus Nezhaarchaeota archaeon]MDW8049596.1 glycerol kinase GlpK [Nitrososphaerota archaeon]